MPKERQNFLSVSPEVGETINNFIIRLKKTVEHCEYGVEEENQIRGRVMYFIRDKVLKIMLFREETLSLTKLQEIDDFRGACAVKGNGAVAGHVKRVDQGDVFDALLFREETLTRHYFILKFDFSWGIRPKIWAKVKLREYFSICNVIVT